MCFSSEIQSQLPRDAEIAVCDCLVKGAKRRKKSFLDL